MTRNAIQLKLDELIRVNAEARDPLMKLEDRSEAELTEVKTEFAQVADREQPN